MANDLEEMEVDEFVKHEAHRNALTAILDALAPLDRVDRVKIITCVCRFFELPRSE